MALAQMACPSTLPSARRQPAFGSASRSRATSVRVCCQAQREAAPSRRNVLQQTAAAAAAAAVLVFGAAPAPQALADSLPTETSKMLCDAECEAKLASIEGVTTPSGLVYKDIVLGDGPNPPVGFQVVANYVAMTPKLRVFESSLEKGKPYDIRVGAGQVIPGLDEGLLTMKPGGLRRLYIPGSLAFPKGLKAAPGRPAVPPASPVVFDVQLLYIPGLE